MEGDCPKCGGLGFVFEDLKYGQRRQLLCPDCAGRGDLPTALARNLSGQTEDMLPFRTAEEMTKDLISRRADENHQTSN